MASAASVTERPIASQNQPQRQQPILKCPRCESLNTKFCYYNNYSLSQPRHFCKSCKRYWTRGGTLRNVPIGGGCRRNKRIKRTITTTTTTNSTTINQDATTSVTFGQNLNPNSNPNNLDHSSHLITNHLKPLHGLLQQNPNKYPRFNTNVSRYDLIQPQMISSLGLGFSSSDHEDTSIAHNSSSLVSSYPSLFNGGSTSIDPTMASVLASSLPQQSRFMGFGTYGDHGAGSLVNNVLMEGAKGSTDWNNCFNIQSNNNQIKAVESSDPASFQWTTTDGDGDRGDWLDPTTNIGSSVPSLI